MLKINRKPMIENIVLKFLDQGFSKFNISTHYKATLIKNYFKKRNFELRLFFLTKKSLLVRQAALDYLKIKKIFLFIMLTLSQI